MVRFRNSCQVCSTFTYDPRNQHGGVMPALPGDFELSGKQAAIVLEKCAETKGVSYELVVC